jgi:hypothetical protein
VRPATGFYEQQDMLGWAAQVCRRIDGDAMPAARAALATLETALQVMRTDVPADRVDANRDIGRAMAQLADATGAAHGGHRFRTPFYENCYVRHCGQPHPRELLAPYADQFALLQSLSNLLDMNNEIGARLADYFVAQYGSEGVCADVTGFLERFDSLYTPAALAGRFDGAGIAPDSALTAAIIAARQALDEHVLPMLAQGRDVELNPAALAELLAMAPWQLRTRAHSYSYLVQAASDGHGPLLVLNQVFGGRGALLSRFMEVLDDAGQRQVRAYLRQFAGAGRVAELGGVFGFNANRHPPCADDELVVAPLPPSFPGTGKIALAALRLAYCARSHRLVFLDAAGEQVTIVYQGFLNPGLLPNLHRVLALGFGEGASFAINSALIRRHKDDPKALLCCPRVSIGRVVLSRRTWLVGAALCPDASGPADKFYVAVR